MTRARLIDEYRELVYRAGEYDIWDDEIEPKLKSMTDKEICEAYEDDMNWYEYRSKMIQV